jgi:hypothetical protein
MATPDDAVESTELRRLLRKEKEAHATDVERLNEANRRALELADWMGRARDLFEEMGFEGGDRVKAIDWLRDHSSVYRAMRSDLHAHVLSVFGCAACQGEHRGIWTQDLSPTAKLGAMVPLIECQRAYVCPRALKVVLVSNESEETYLCPT